MVSARPWSRSRAVGEDAADMCCALSANSAAPTSRAAAASHGGLHVRHRLKLRPRPTALNGTGEGDEAHFCCGLHFALPGAFYFTVAGSSRWYMRARSAGVLARLSATPSLPLSPQSSTSISRRQYLVLPMGLSHSRHARA